MRRQAPYFLAVSLALPTLSAQPADHPPARSVTDPGVVTTRQGITPAGVPAIFRGRVFGVAFGTSSADVWVLNATHLYRMDWRSNKVAERIALPGNPGLQGLRFDPSSNSPVLSSLTKDRKTALFRVTGGNLSPIAQGQGTHIAGAVAIAPGKAAVAPLIFDNKLAIADLGTGEARTVATDIAPFAAAIDQAGTVAWVSNWGGRRPKPEDLTLPTGLAPTADRVVVDKRGIASTGTVIRLDLKGSAEPVRVAVGLHPTGLAWDEQNARLYVANSNSDSISVIDTGAHRVVRTIELQPFTDRVTGVAPTAIAVSSDGARLWVACGGINAIAQVRTGDGKLEGLIPTAWYPNALSLSADGKYLAVATLLGAGSGWRDDPKQRFVHAYRGSVHVIELPDQSQLASYTTAVAENNHLRLGSPEPRVEGRLASATPLPVPARSGDPSTIEHIVYIVKENRTYDQVFGDMPKGNGDPSLVMFGQDVTPNTRGLAGRYVLLDNFYATGGNSGDGHQWLTQANETAYCLWPGYAGRSYPFDGTDPIAYSSGGFIWDYALARGKSVRVYGEYAGRLSEARAADRVELLKRWEAHEDFTRTWNIRAPLEPLNAILAANYPSYTNAIPDVVRASILKADIAKWEREGKMPNLVIAQLPSDHTYGTMPGASTPKAMVADNDYALGLIVEALSKTQFWRKMAIFVVEDDAQNGVDHVDGHRTVALVVSPWARRDWVDSTFYSNQSMLKTIELILGLPTMSLFDLIANDMRHSFTAEPDFAPYTAVKPTQSLYALNPNVSALRGAERRAALDSARMRWEVPDAAPTARLNRILWHSIRGWNTPYPGSRNAVFAPLAIESEDDER